MLRNTLLALALTVPCIVPLQAQEADRIPMLYETLSPLDARAALLWSDVAGLIAMGGPAVEVLSYSLPTSNQGSFVVQILSGGGMCGLTECTVRIAENGVPISDFSACIDFSTHELSIDGTRFFACGTEIDLTETVPPAGLVPAR